MLLVAGRNLLPGNLSDFKAHKYTLSAEPDFTAAELRQLLFH